MQIPIQAFVDFDGTISLLDTTDLLFSRFAEPAWRDVERAWERDEIGSRECMVRQIALMRATSDALDAFTDGVQLDPAFPAFAQFCAKLGISLTVLSDGLDRVIAMALARIGLELPIRANRLMQVDGDRWTLQFPYASDECRSLAGHCKCRSMASLNRLSVFIGDGQSDFCAARQADFVFAKSKLLAFCREQELSHAAFESFAELPRLMSAWIAARAPGWSARKPCVNRNLNHAE